MDLADQIRVVTYLRGRTKPTTRGQFFCYAAIQRSKAAEIQVFLDHLVQGGWASVERVKLSGPGHRADPVPVYRPTPRLVAASLKDLRFLTLDPPPVFRKGKL
jgi:hypothetical protein